MGGKGGSLGELQRAGIAVPPGFVVRTEAFERFIVHWSASAPLRRASRRLSAEDLDAVAPARAELRARVEARSAATRRCATELIAAHAALVRCRRDSARRGALVGDHRGCGDASFAGLQDTYLWVTHAEPKCCSLSAAAGPACIRWSRSPIAAGAACRRRAWPWRWSCRRMVDARTAGVMFTRSPTTGDRSVIASKAPGAWARRWSAAK